MSSEKFERMLYCNLLGFAVPVAHCWAEGRPAWLDTQRLRLSNRKTTRVVSKCVLAPKASLGDQVPVQRVDCCEFNDLAKSQMETRGRNRASPCLSARRSSSRRSVVAPIGRIEAAL